MAHTRKPMQGLVLQILLDLASRGVLIDLLASFMGGVKGEKKQAKAKLGLYNIMAIGVAVLLLLIAMGFLVAAGYMQLATHFPASLAALLTAGGLVLLAVCVLLLAKPRAKKQPNPEPAQPVEGVEAFMQPILSVLHNIIDYAKKNPDIIAGVALMVGVWLSMGDGDKDGDKSDTPAE